MQEYPQEAREQNQCQILLAQTHLGWFGFAFCNNGVFASSIGLDDVGFLCSELARRPAPGLSTVQAVFQDLRSHVAVLARAAEKSRPLAMPKFFFFAQLPGKDWVGLCELTPQSGAAWLLRVALEDYLSGRPTSFGEIPVVLPRLTPFSQRVLELCRGIPFGQTISYQELARRLGAPRAARAVGQALAKNPLPLIIPCHRVVASSGDLRGFSAPGGVATKARLLAWERHVLETCAADEVSRSGRGPSDR